MQHWADIQPWENAKMLNSIQMCGDKERFLLSCNVFQLRKLLVVLFHWTPQSSAHNQQPTIPAAWGLLCALLWPDAVNLSHLSSLLLTRTEASAALALPYCTCLSYSSLETGESHVSLLIAQHFLLWCVRLNAEFSDATDRQAELNACACAHISLARSLSLSSTMSIRDRVRFALCKQLTCACSALSAVTCEEPVSSLPFAHATLQYGWPFSVREGEQIPIMVYLVTCKKSFRAFVWQKSLDGCFCNRGKAMIHPAVVLFLRILLECILYHWGTMIFKESLQLD